MIVGFGGAAVAKLAVASAASSAVAADCRKSEAQPQRHFFSCCVGNCCRCCCSEARPWIRLKGGANWRIVASGTNKATTNDSTKTALAAAADEGAAVLSSSV